MITKLVCIVGFILGPCGHHYVFVRSSYLKRSQNIQNRFHIYISSEYFFKQKTKSTNIFFFRFQNVLKKFFLTRLIKLKYVFST
jgi:hypothetical protein